MHVGHRRVEYDAATLSEQLARSSVDDHLWFLPAVAAHTARTNAVVAALSGGGRGGRSQYAQACRTGSERSVLDSA